MHVAGGHSVHVPPDRREELSRIEDALAECQGGVARTILVEGGAGCGKTELLDAVAARSAASGAVALRAGPSRLAGRRPYATLRQLARHLTHHCDGGGQGARSPAPEMADWFVDLVHRVAAETPVVILVDDLHDVDRESAHLLLAAAGVWRSAKVLLVLSQLPFVPPTDPTVITELLRRPGFTRIRLGLLDERAVAAALAACDDVGGDDVGGDRLAEVTYRACGGNPLLLRALLDEYRTSSPHVPEGGPVPGGSFSHAVLTCLLRSGRPATKVARALAVLGDSVSTRLVAQLLEAGPELVAHGLRALEGAGLVHGTRLRPAVAAVVLDRMSDERRTALHHRAAVLLHTAGAASSVVAHHLLAARRAPEPWGIVALDHAAEQALADDDWRLAIAYLELAHGACSDDRHRTRIKVQLALIFWRINPSAAERHVTELLASAGGPALSPPVTGMWAKLLVSHGLVEEAVAVLDEGAAAGGGDGPPPGIAPGVAMLWARFSYPQVADGVPELRAAGTDVGSPEPAPLATRLCTAMASWLGGVRVDQATRAAEQLLEVSPLTDGTLSAVTGALRTLLQSGRFDRAIRWCDRFLDEAARRELPGWISVFRAVRAWALLHQGRLAEAVLDGEQALAVVPERRGWIFLGGATATVVTAHTAMGQYQAAANHLNQPVPDGLFRSTFGLGYLRARGRYCLATNRPHAALADFMRVGDMLGGWGLDHPAVVPWRSDAAEAWLQLQEPAQAARLLADERPRSRGIPHLHGLVLRLTAATVEPEQRPALLTQAVEELQASGDRLALARALVDLGDAHEALGDTNRAGTVRRRAWNVAHDCGAQPLCERLAPGGVVRVGRQGGPEPARPRDGGDVGPLPKLSSSELRVAALAACGHTNQEISARLYVTVSTVEQHLTRVYRKLGIGGRDELPIDLRDRDQPASAAATIRATSPTWSLT